MTPTSVTHTGQCELGLSELCPGVRRAGASVRFVLHFEHRERSASVCATHHHAHHHGEHAIAQAHEHDPSSTPRGLATHLLLRLCKLRFHVQMIRTLSDL